MQDGEIGVLVIGGICAVALLDKHPTRVIVSLVLCTAMWIFGEPNFLESSMAFASLCVLGAFFTRTGMKLLACFGVGFFLGKNGFNPKGWFED